MTIITILPEYFEYFTVETHPFRQFSASGYSESSFFSDEDFTKVTQYSYTHVTGNVNVYARRSDYDKDVRTFEKWTTPDYVENDLIELDYKLAKTAATQVGNNFANCAKILERVNNRRPSERKNTTVEVLRFPVPIDHVANFFRKQTIREVLYPYYRTTYPTLHWAYSNYNCLNFFTGSNDTESLPTGSVLMYANTNGVVGAPTSGSIEDNIYIPDAAFTFDFRINPRYTQANVTDPWNPGTIFHLPDVFAVSVISGTHRDASGFIDRFGLMLQVREGCLINPNDVTVGSGIFTSSLDALKRNHWHHVVIRWGTNSRDNGTGSFIVDGQNVGNFVIPSSSLRDTLTTNSDVLFVGNYFEGTTTDSSYFFATQPSLVSASLPWLLNVPSVNAPTTYDFKNPLNAEVHELRIWNKYLDDITLSQTSASSIVDNSDLLFYVPPFFTPESTKRRLPTSLSSILNTNRSTDDPFNVALAFSTGAHYVNVENFTRDFANSNYPLHWELTASVIPSTAISPLEDVNNVLYNQRPHVKRRNLLIMPCDDGLFIPDYAVLLSGTITGEITSGNMNYKYTNDLDIFDPSIISLTNMIPDVEYTPIINSLGQTEWQKVINVDPAVTETSILSNFAFTVQQKTRNESSNQVTIFDISNLYYGNRIRPKTFEITDPYLTGSAGKISVTLKDDGYGCLYRADSDTPHATWAHVGNVLYDEGICVVKSPHLYFFGKEAHELQFDGVRNIHSFKVRIPAAAGLINSSSNPSYQPVSASLDANDYDQKFVYITGINLHDENLNVVMKGTLAQPVVKRTGDKIMFKLGVDF
jgi:hypothetical protein